MIDQRKKRQRKLKLPEREYHVQEDADVAQKYVEMFCNKNQFPSFPFCVTHTKLHGVRGFRKNYYM